MVFQTRSGPLVIYSLSRPLGWIGYIGQPQNANLRIQRGWATPARQASIDRHWDIELNAIAIVFLDQLNVCQ